MAGEPGETVPPGASATARTGCPAGAQASGTVPQVSGRDGLPSPRAHTQDQSRKLKTSAEPPAPDQHMWVSCVTCMVLGHFMRVQAASSGVKTALFSIL